MLPLDIDGRLQVTAAASLLDFSRLVHWDRDAAQFVALLLDGFGRDTK